ncbi:hypothetical protein WICMUC_001177 [Wickerhamomyces mucosus]|uniref:Uncharacterized protein n=1 Tax=Wickerhamomyces mucosus TaxID=1378264 RepID=A0A9P8PVN3_9ASCO|nr:hypothetical protein WICMUC_001177 [Wickerhamomyces mucosus]
MSLDNTALRQKDIIQSLSNNDMSFKELINDENLVIDPLVLVCLFRMVGSKLRQQLEKSDVSFQIEWTRALTEINKAGIEPSHLTIISRLTKVHLEKYLYFEKRIDILKDTSVQFCDRLELQLQNDYIGFVELLFKSRELLITMYSFFDDVDSLCSDIADMFKTLTEFLIESIVHIDFAKDHEIGMIQSKIRGFRIN